jgi:hypothetical protein
MKRSTLRPCMPPPPSPPNPRRPKNVTPKPARHLPPRSERLRWPARLPCLRAGHAGRKERLPRPVLFPRSGWRRHLLSPPRASSPATSGRLSSSPTAPLPVGSPSPLSSLPPAASPTLSSTRPTTLPNHQRPPRGAGWAEHQTAERPAALPGWLDHHYFSQTTRPEDVRGSAPNWNNLVSNYN